ncbi:14035_t:CDS:2 [Acaulospora colombiana]|uniref:14035_t:CDS:1 n=1 Tax=Acaulospora colombiana TaxID=27376 RepID=A0ACA9KXB6_9GLOM|nr:14035_t:CDS:2 [Acaulospora colombiana]
MLTRRNKGSNNPNLIKLKDEYEQVPLGDLDENGKTYKPLRSHGNKREFYFDVHPPLGKMIVSLAGFLAGYNGSFDFESGSKYPEDVNYTFMRIFLASFGAWMAPLSYFTAIELDFSRNSTGPGDSQMSSLFQAHLNGNIFHKNPLELAYDSRFTLKNKGFGGGLLHSHIQTYPKGSEQQQVTCYHHGDENNDWIIKKVREAPPSDNETEVEFIKNKEEVRLLHAKSGRNLHSHRVNAPVTKSQWEVSCYGNDTIGDKNDYWIIEVYDDTYPDTDRIRSLTTTLRLRHSVLALYFSILMAGFMMDHLTSNLKQKTRTIIFGISYVLVIGVFLFFKDIAFGIDYPAKDYKGRKWLSTWNIVD